MGRPKKSKEFKQYLVDFEFYYITSFTKQKSMLKLQVFAPCNSPDESIKYVYSIVGQAYKSTFNKGEFNKNVLRFREFNYIHELSEELAKNNIGLTDTAKIKTLSTLFKKHLLS